MAEFKGYLENQNLEIALSTVKSLTQFTKEEAAPDGSLNNSLAKGNLTQSQEAEKEKRMVTLDNFEITKSRTTGKSGRKKFAKASGASNANPLMTLDFFEGSGVGAS